MRGATKLSVDGALKFYLEHLYYEITDMVSSRTSRLMPRKYRQQTITVSFTGLSISSFNLLTLNAPVNLLQNWKLTNLVEQNQVLLLM
jgi:hypothetical protein